MNMRKTVKRNAKNAMRTKYGRSMVMVMLLMGINILFYLMDSTMLQVLQLPIFDNIEAGITPSLIMNINLTIPMIIGNIIMSVLYFLVMAPLYYGVSGWFYRVVGSENCEISSAFNFFESAKLMSKSWHATISVFFRKLIYVILCSIPGTIVTGAGAYYKQLSMGDSDHSRFVLSLCLEALGICLWIIAGILLFIYFKKYSLVKYIIANDKRIKVKNAIKFSSKITKDQKCQIATFDFSFVLWFAVCVFVIPVLYVSPYYMTSKALYSKVLIEKYNLQKEAERAEKVKYEASTSTEETNCTETNQNTEKAE